MPDAGDLLNRWERFLELLGGEIFKGYAAVDALTPIAGYSQAAMWLVRYEAKSGNYIRRKIGAMLAGHIRDADSSLLSELFEAERARDAAVTPDSTDRLYFQSVVEDIVFAAIRWCGVERLKPSGMRLLRRIVELTIGGEYWNTSSYAMAGLCNGGIDQADPLLQQFHEFASGKAPPTHPCRPSLNQERHYAEGLVSRDAQILQSVLPAEPEGFDFTPEDRAALDALLEVAKAFASC